MSNHIERILSFILCGSRKTQGTQYPIFIIQQARRNEKKIWGDGVRGVGRRLAVYCKISITMVICYLESFFSKSLGVSSFLAVFSDLTMKVNFPVNVNCSANQCNGFYMITAPVMKGLSNSTANQKRQIFKWNICFFWKAFEFEFTFG